MLALLLALAANDPQPLVPRRVEWGELTAVFPDEWRLPERLWMPAEEAAADKVLSVRLERLLGERFEAPSSAPWMASFGDMLAEHARRGGARAQLDALLAELAHARPRVHAEVGELLAQLLDDSALRDPDWDPDRDRADDGLYFGPLLERRKLAELPWSTQGGSHKLHQACAFIRGDLEAVKLATDDFDTLARDPSSAYERFDVPRASLVEARDSAGVAATALRMRFRQDLPFPFGHYDCDLRVLDTLDGGGRLVTYIYSPSHDFHWFAGSDLHLPVRTVAGEWVGTLLVRICGFDLRGVPDDDGDRMDGTRSALGKLKRRAELAFERAQVRPRTVSDALPARTFVAPTLKR